jgi:hypothetical protein
MLMLLLALLGQPALGADAVRVADFRLRWLLHQESGGIEQLEQWNVACLQAKCTIGRWFSGRDFGQKAITAAQAKDILGEADQLPALDGARPQAAGASHHEERIWVDLSDKNYSKVRPDTPETDDISTGLAWAKFELDLRHAWEGQDR